MNITVFIAIIVYNFFMIRLLQSGTYHLIQTRGHTKILTLNGKRTYAWVVAGNIGEILVTSHKQHHVDHTLSIGKYRLYDVKNEPGFRGVQHLELLVGLGVWQGYTLPTGLPTDVKKRNRIVPVREIITRSQFSGSTVLLSVFA
jgi:hypothetical protein